MLYLTAIIADITEDVIRPLLLSAVPSDEISTGFNASVNARIRDIINALNGRNVNLTRTLFDYFVAISRVYFDDAVDSLNAVSGINLTLDINQTNCGEQAVFRRIYTNADATAELVELFQNISQAVRIIKQVHTYVHTV